MAIARFDGESVKKTEYNEDAARQQFYAISARSVRWIGFLVLAGGAIFLSPVLMRFFF